MELEQRKKTFRTAVVVLSLALMTWIWLGLDLSTLEPRTIPRPRWRAADSVVVPEEFSTIWFPKSPSGAVVGSSGKAIDVDRAIHVSSVELQQATFHVVTSTDEDFADVSKDGWTPCPSSEPQLSKHLANHKAVWASRGIEVQAAFKTLSPDTIRASLKQTYDKFNTGTITNEEFVYDVVKTQGVWNVVPVEWWYRQENSHSMAAKDGVRFVSWCVRTSIRFALSIVLFIPVLLVMSSMQKKNIVVRWILRECLYWWLPKRFHPASGTAV